MVSIFVTLTSDYKMVYIYMFSLFSLLSLLGQFTVFSSTQFMLSYYSLS